MYLLGFILKRLPSSSKRRLEGIVMVGADQILLDALSVCEDFRSSSPDLFAELCRRGTITIYYFSQLDHDTEYKNQFFVARNWIAWGKTGLLANLVWTAFRVKAGLNRPLISFRDYYRGSPLKRAAALQMKQWLEFHGQPAEFIRIFSEIYQTP